MATKSTSLIIPCYFADQALLDMTVSCVNSLSHGEPDEVIIIDDGSPVKPKEERALFKNYIRRKNNGGFAKAVNTGLKAAKGDVLIISNNDVTFTEGWLEGLIRPLQEDFDIATIRTSNHTTKVKEKTTEGDKFDAIWAMHRYVYEALGPLDELFGNYFEDTDYKTRAEKAGFRIGKNHRVFVHHVGKATMKVVDPEDSYYHSAMSKYREKYGKID